jgi:hypothetical protein
MDHERVPFRLLNPAEKVISDFDSREVGMGEWAMGKNLLHTEGASTCIVLVAHNDETGIGMLGHFTAVGMEQGRRKINDKEKFIEAINLLDELGDPKYTNVVLVGGAPFMENGLDTVDEDRKFAVNALLLTGWAPQTEWSPQNQVVDVRLRNHEGILQVVTFDTTVANEKPAA